MSLRRHVDRLLAVSYLGLTLAACGGGTPGPVMPVGGQPVEPTVAREWVASRKGPAPVMYRFRWLFRDPEQSAGGRGSVRVAPGDSLRLDMIGPLGAGRGGAFIVGDSSQWAEPEDEVGKLVPNYPLLWAIIGVPRLPAGTREVTRFQDQSLVAWRFVDGADTVEYAWMAGPPARLITDVRNAGGRLGRVETVFGPDGTLKSSRLDAPRRPARLEITYGASSTPDAFPPDTWVRPQP
ncbi:MAG: hypothetical protein H6R40_1067 [Gemmatimonadetes bacterium]|nr:hypothetical protein [Gemmatimonadota bacterium]